MERRHFLKIAFGFAAGAVVMASAAKVAEAAPLAPRSPLPQEPIDSALEAQPALATQDDVDNARIEQVRWHRRGHWHRRRYWGWHRRRYWGWHRRRHWRRR